MDLLGEWIRTIRIAKDRSAIEMEATSVSSAGPFLYRCSNDCCNEVWIEHVTGVDSILSSCNEPEKQIVALDLHVVDDLEPHLIANQIQRTESKDGGDAGVETTYYFRLRTKKGTFTIELRNNHNGYYGGKLERALPGELPRDLEWVDVKEDL